MQKPNCGPSPFSLYIDSRSNGAYNSHTMSMPERRVKRKWTVRWYHIAIGIVLILPVAGIFVSCGGPATGTTEWHYNQGYDLVEQGRYREAIEELNQAIHLNPEYALAYNNRGSAYHYLDQQERAVQDFNEAIRLDPD